jgi:hypothetical protein
MKWKKSMTEKIRVGYTCFPVAQYKAIKAKMPDLMAAYCRTVATIPVFKYFFRNVT